MKTTGIHYLWFQIICLHSCFCIVTNIHHNVKEIGSCKILLKKLTFVHSLQFGLEGDFRIRGQVMGHERRDLPKQMPCWRFMSLQRLHAKVTSVHMKISMCCSLMQQSIRAGNTALEQDSIKVCAAPMQSQTFKTCFKTSFLDSFLGKKNQGASRKKQPPRSTRKHFPAA